MSEISRIRLVSAKALLVLSLDPPTIILFPTDLTGPNSHSPDAGGLWGRHSPDSSSARPQANGEPFSAAGQPDFTAALRTALRVIYRMLMSAIQEELDGARAGAEAIATDLASALFVMVVRIHLCREGRDSGLLALPAHRQLGRAVAAMVDDPARSWTLDELAACANASRASLVRMFRWLSGPGVPAGDARADDVEIVKRTDKARGFLLLASIRLMVRRLCRNME
jgi:hypothetical protein